MTVEPNQTAESASHEGQTYWFCSQGCRAKFEADPAKYVGGKSGGSRQKPIQAFLKKLKFGRG
jgi:Cu+-exporting ATPase